MKKIILNFLAFYFVFVAAHAEKNFNVVGENTKIKEIEKLFQFW